MRHPLTPEEQAAADAWWELLVAEEEQSKHCPLCGQPLAAVKQAKRCLYASPCGCRLGQGRLTEEERATWRRVQQRQRVEDEQREAGQQTLW